VDQGRPKTNDDPHPKDRASKPEDPAATHPTEDEKQDEERRDDAVDEASEDSFPSSDAPSW
jgi:hypothetical protein